MKVWDQRQVLIQTVSHLKYQSLDYQSANDQCRLSNKQRVFAVTHWRKPVGHAEASEAWDKDNVNKLEDEEHFVINPDKTDSIPC